MDGWAHRRRQALDDFEARVQKAVGDRIVQKKIELLDRLEEIEDRFLDECGPGRLKFRSLDGAVDAVVRLVRLAEDLRGRIIGPIDLQSSGDQDRTPVPKLTMNEAMEAARKILEVRRRILRG